MPRRRLGVVLLVAEPAATEIQGLRRALGDPAIDRVPTHITLVPPVNVRDENLPEALRVLRDAAAAWPHALVLDLGPPLSFRPDSDTLYLAVSGEDVDDARLDELRRRAFRPPLERPLERPFVAHVTIGDGIAPDRIDGALAVLAGYRTTVVFDRVHLLEDQRVNGHRRWVPIADMAFAEPMVVGRGGVELELRRSELLDPEARLLVDSARERDPIEHDDDELLTVDEDPMVRGATAVVVTARRSGELVAVGTGWHHPDLMGEVTGVAVAFAHHGQGIARQVRLALEDAMARAIVDGGAGAQPPLA